MSSHRPTILTPLVLLLTAAAAVVDATTLTHEFTENSDLLAGCRFSLGRKNYDLCPLMWGGAKEAVGSTWALDESGRSLLTRRLYSFTLGGARPNQQCPEGTWICMTETRGEDNLQHEEPTRTTYTPIAGRMRHQSSLVDQGVNARASVFEDDIHGSSPLTLFLNGGIHENKPRYAWIEFICDPDSESTVPSFSGEEHGVHSFTWPTKHGCPILDSDVATKSDADSDSALLHTLENEDTTEDSDAEKEGGELVDKFPDRLSRRWIVFILSTGALLISISLFIASPDARAVFSTQAKYLATALHLPALKRSTRAFVAKPFQFRASDFRLVRWAEEDMSLGVLDDEERRDVDVMVNGGSRGMSHWDGEGMDEYIPLKAGSLGGTRQDYGSSRGRQFW
ncbi:hypothetical protein H0H81_005704 [Sphagnurus paluster]|uniref:Autophagy-related protein 27 n=1 Tax=Sphagnurus paluster TaxID=117069 RepID=A0A9P7KM52_9AGAR|nr:hypothetical protein H0H81_005704 [Sphagnurus paluster]